MLTLACGVSDAAVLVSVVVEDDGSLLITREAGDGTTTTERLGSEAVSTDVHRFQDAQRVDADEAAA